MNTKKKKQTILNLLLLICLVTCLYSVGMLVKYYFEYKHIEDSYNAIKDEVVIDKQTIDVDTPELKECPYSLVDVNALMKKNENCVGYIIIPDTDISYPIMQAEDNQHYLDKGFDEQWSNGGSIFIDCRNASDFSDHNTIIYGHHMKNGSMFAPAKNYIYDSDFFYSHPTILVYTKDTVNVYQVFSSLTSKERSVVYTKQFVDDEMLNNHIQNQAKQSVFTVSNIPENVKGMITLSTCKFSSGHTRIVTMAALVEQYPNY